VWKLDTLGQVLDEVVQQGANRIQGVSFSVAEPIPVLDEARLEAELYAREAGVEVGRVLLIQEQPPHLPAPPVAGLARAEAAGVPIAEGEQEFGAVIRCAFTGWQ
jgi:uncharacterized protein YggE